MSSTSRSLLVAATIGAVEALKDQAGFCRWNYAFRVLQQHAKANLRSYSSQAQKLSAGPLMNSGINKQQQQSEESLRKVMFLSCWGPN